MIIDRNIKNVTKYLTIAQVFTKSEKTILEYKVPIVKTLGEECTYADIYNIIKGIVTKIQFTESSDFIFDDETDINFKEDANSNVVACAIMDILFDCEEFLDENDEYQVNCIDLDEIIGHLKPIYTNDNIQIYTPAIQRKYVIEKEHKAVPIFTLV